MLSVLVSDKPSESLMHHISWAVLYPFHFISYWFTCSNTATPTKPLVLSSCTAINSLNASFCPPLETCRWQFLNPVVYTLVSMKTYSTGQKLLHLSPRHTQTFTQGHISWPPCRKLTGARCQHLSLICFTLCRSGMDFFMHILRLLHPAEGFTQTLQMCCPISLSLCLWSYRQLCCYIRFKVKFLDIRHILCLNGLQGSYLQSSSQSPHFMSEETAQNCTRTL